MNIMLQKHMHGLLINITMYLIINRIYIKLDINMSLKYFNTSLALHIFFFLGFTFF